MRAFLMTNAHTVIKLTAQVKSFNAMLCEAIPIRPTEHIFYSIPLYNKKAPLEALFSKAY